MEKIFRRNKKTAYSEFKKILMNAFWEITVFHLFLFTTEIFRDSLLIIKFIIVCAIFFYIFRLNL